MGSSSTVTPEYHQAPERHERSRPGKGMEDSRSLENANAMGVVAERRCERRITGLIAAACRLAASSEGVRSVRIIVPCHLTTPHLVRLHEVARHRNARLDVAGGGTIIVHADALANEQPAHSPGERIWSLIGSWWPGSGSRPGPKTSWPLPSPIRHGDSTL